VPVDAPITRPPASDRKPYVHYPLESRQSAPRFLRSAALWQIRPEHVTPALDVLLADAAAAVERAAQPITPASWADVVEPVERATEPLSRAWSVVGHLNAVADTPELRAVYGENLPRVTEFWSSVGQNLALYEKYKALHASSDFSSLTGERKKILGNALRDFRLSGAELPEDQKPHFAELQERRRGCRKRFRITCSMRRTRTPISSKPAMKHNWPACPKT
jgi:Zn-dependent oligopeptidases